MNKIIATSVAKNTVIQFGQQIATWISSFLLMLFLPRILGPERFGRIYLAEMVTAIFIVLVMYDGRLSIVRRVSRNREHAAEILSNSLGFRAALWLLAFIVMMVFGYAAHYPASVIVILFLFGVEMTWVAMRTVLSGIYLGFENTTYTAVGAIAERMFIAGVGIAALLLGGTEITIAVVMIIGTLLNFIICARYIGRFVGKLPRINWHASWILMKEGFPFLLWTIFGMIYYRIDTVMLSLMTTEKVVGWYGASYRFYDVLAFLPSIFTLAILPVLSKLFDRDQPMLVVTTRKSLNFILFTGIPISISIYFFSREIIGFLFGLGGYGPSVINLQLFAVGLILLYIDMVLGTAIIACNQQKQLAWIAFIALIVNVGLNYFMIPYAQARTGNGGIGAAIATLITEFVVLLSNLLILDRSILKDADSSVFLKAILGGAVMLIAQIVLAGSGLGLYWMLQAAVGFGIYLSVLLALKTFSRAEIDFVREFVSIRNIRQSLSSRKTDAQ